MKLVIDISKKWYERACKANMSLDGALPIYQAIKEGTPYEERPHGEWIKFTLEGGFLSSHKCSKCGFNGNQLWNFCPNCGSDNRPKGGE